MQFYDTHFFHRVYQITDYLIMGGCLEAIISIFKVRRMYHISGRRLRELHQIA
jgi:hypothetical protein